jgi:2-dehydropantoate 2-reductase
MNIAIIGAGAMGSLFGALLAEAGETVTLLDIRPDHVEAVNTHGLSIERDGAQRVVRIPATTDPTGIGPVDLAVVFVKSTHTPEAAATAARLAADRGLVLTLQNGMGNTDVLSGVIDAARILAGTTAHGATFLKPGAIRHAGVGDTLIGPWGATQPSGAGKIAAVLTRAGITARAVAAVRPVLWAKLFINVGINAITALTGIRNGELLDLAATRQLCRDAVSEAVAVARARGIAVDGDPSETVFSVASATGLNRSSMGQDVDSRRPTEIAAINGFIVRQGEAAGVPVPVNRTLNALVETLQGHY